MSYKRKVCGSNPTSNIILIFVMIFLYSTDLLKCKRERRRKKGKKKTKEARKEEK